MISIIIPCYNVENFVEKCIKSILIQKEIDFEIILVNDGSTDNTLQFLEKLSKTNNRIKVISQENRGLSGARNTGVENTKGEFIMFVDADDWLESNAFEMISKYFKQEDLFCFSYNRVFENKVLPRDLKINGFFEANFIQRRMVGLLGEELSDPSQADSLVTAWGKIYKTTIIKNNNIRFTDTKEIGTEDALFNIQYLNFAKEINVINIPLYNYLKNNQESLTKLYKPNLFVQWKNLYAKILEIIKNKDHNFQKALNNRIALSIIGLGLNETFSNQSFHQKKLKISEILNDSLYQKAYQDLDLKFFPIHWKLFFYLAKNKKSLLLLLMLQMIKSQLK